MDNNSHMLPKVYLRYVDDAYAAFADINNCSGIKFTMEKVNKTLNFLDVEIELNDVSL